MKNKKTEGMFDDVDVADEADAVDEQAALLPDEELYIEAMDEVPDSSSLCRKKEELMERVLGDVEHRSTFSFLKSSTDFEQLLLGFIAHFLIDDNRELIEGSDGVFDALRVVLDKLVYLPRNMKIPDLRGEDNHKFLLRYSFDFYDRTAVQKDKKFQTEVALLQMSIKKITREGFQKHALHVYLGYMCECVFRIVACMRNGQKPNSLAFTESEVNAYNQELDVAIRKHQFESTLAVDLTEAEKLRLKVSQEFHKYMKSSVQN